MTELRKILLCDGEGNPIGSYQGAGGNYAIDIHDADVHSVLFNHYAVYEDGTTTTLNGAILIGATSAIFTSVAGFIVGDFVDMNSGSTHIHHYRQITAIVSNTVTFDAPIDQDFANGSVMDKAVFNMAVNGSLSSPIIFTVPPHGAEVFHLTKILLAMVHAGVPDDGKFGGITALTNGIVLRVNRNNGESFETLAIWKSNKDIKEDLFDLVYTDKAPAGANGTNGMWDIEGMGGIIRLDAGNNDVLEILVQDNLTTLVDLQYKLQGHFE